MRISFGLKLFIFFFNGSNNFLPLPLLYHFFPQENGNISPKAFFNFFLGRPFIISLCELTQMWNYHKFIYTCYAIPPLFRLHRLCLLVSTRSLTFNESATVTGFLDCQRKLQQHNVCVIQDLVCVKTSYEHISQLRHMVLCEKKNQHKSAITATLQKACEKSAHLHGETKQLIIWWGSSYFPESNWRVII